VTYMVAGGTIEEFVRTVLEAKSCIVDDLIESRSLGDLDTDVMGELRRRLKRLAGRVESVGDATDPGQLAEVLRAAGAEYLDEQAVQLDAVARRALLPVSESAIRALAAVLSGPSRAVYRIASSRDRDVFYTLEVVGADVTCDCRGFHYRGACVHARALKETVAAGADAPEGYIAVE